MSAWLAWRRLKIAPLRVRLIAGLIDASVGLGALAVGIVLFGFKASRPEFDHLVRRFVPRFQPLEVGDEVRPQWRAPGIKLRYRLALWAGSLILAVVGRNHRSLGRRRMGLRTVELATGGPVSVRAALVRFGAVAAWKRLVELPFRPREKRMAQRYEGLNEELKEIRRRHAHDEGARRSAEMRVFQGRGINAFASCGWALGRIVLNLVPIWLTPRHRSIPDLVAGLVVVEE